MSNPSMRRRIEADNEMQRHAGGKAAKRPADIVLEQNGVVDLKRLCPPEYVASVTPVTANGQPPQNNAERAEAGLEPITVHEMSPRQPPPLHLYVGQYVELVLPRESFAAASAAIAKRRIWGTHRYTADTDLLLALVHAGFLASFCADASFQWPKRVEQVAVLVMVHPSDAAYPGSLRNGVRSRGWAQPCCGCCISIARAWLLWKEARDKEKEANGETSHRRTVRVELTRAPLDADVEPRRPSVITSTTEEQRSLPRAAATASDRRKRTAQKEDTAVVYNLANEPWLKYSWALVADRGFTPQRCTALKLESRVLFLETEQLRYELAVASSSDKATGRLLFRLSRCKRAYPHDMLDIVGVPLPESHKEVLFDGCPWESFLWGTTSLEVQPPEGGEGATQTFELKRMHWADLRPGKAVAPQAAAQA